MAWAIAAGGACLVSGVATWLLARYRGRWSVLDPVNARSLHTVPVPRTGGIAILLGIVFVALWVFPGRLETVPILSLELLIMAGLLVAAVSLIDDFVHLGVTLRLVMQFVAALLVVAAGLRTGLLIPVGLGGLWVIAFTAVVTVLFVMWMTNLYNFMDGLDGLAGGMTVIGFGTFAFLGAAAGHPVYALFNAGVSGAGLAFLAFNFPPARIFMGDVGSASLGFIAAVMMLWAERNGVFPIWVGVAVFAPFIVDATWTLVRRSFRGSRPWQAHREHFYQRLVLGGWSCRKTLICEYFVMLGSALLGIFLELSRRPTLQYALLGGMAVLYLALIVGVESWDWHRRRSGAVF